MRLDRETGIHNIDFVAPPEIRMRHWDCVDVLSFDGNSVQTVFAVRELYQVAQTISNGPIVLYHDIFQSFNESSLDVSRLSGFHSGINQTLPSSHGVEEKLLRRQTSKIRVFNKTTTFRTVVVFGKMRQCSIFETEWNTFAFDHLLTDASRHLRNVDK